MKDFLKLLGLWICAIGSVLVGLFIGGILGWLFIMPYVFMMVIVLLCCTMFWITDTLKAKAETTYGVWDGRTVDQLEHMSPEEYKVTGRSKFRQGSVSVSKE